MTAKVFIGKLHRWLGLSTGLVVFIVSITGCLYAFEEELFDLYYRSTIYVQVPERAVPKPISELWSIAGKTSGSNKPIRDVVIKDDPAAAYMFVAFKRDREKTGLWANSGYEYYDRIYVDPYTGKVTGQVEMFYNFFTVARDVHQSLYLNYQTGSVVVGSCILVFLLMLISGLILWWPKNKAAARQRFRFMWKNTTGTKRKNYDLHNILGFYILSVGILFCVTGLVWSFNWWEDGIYKMLGSERKVTAPVKPLVAKAAPPASSTIDIIFNDALTKRAHFSRMFFMPDEKKQSVQCFIRYEGSSVWEESDVFYYDLETGKEYARELQEQKTLGKKWRLSNYGIHTGKILGLPGAILAFAGSLICASLPVTGFYIWWGRRRKKIVRK